MLVILISKILMVAFFLSLVTVLRHGYYAIKSIINTDEENTEFYVLNKTQLIFLGIAIAYILTCIFTGILI